jgi:hypothetical protein
MGDDHSRYTQVTPTWNERVRIEIVCMRATLDTGC